MSSWYTAQLAVRPLVTKAWTSACLWGLGDFINQQITPSARNKDGSYNTFTTTRMSAFGALVFTPIADVWYGLLSARFGRPGMAHTLTKVALDQLVFTPIMLSTLYCYTSLTERKPVADGIERAKENLVPTLKVNWVYWPLVQGINLGLVPPHMQLLTINLAMIPWNTYLAMKTAKASQAADAGAAAANRQQVSA